LVPHTRLLRFAVAMLAIGLAGCSLIEPKEQLRGIKVDADQLKELTPGTSTRVDVTALLGSPTMHATFDDNTWLYVSQVTRPRIGGTQAVEQQHVVVVSFDNRGVLSGVTSKSQDDSLPVEVVDRTTPSPGSEASFLQQLFGNIGRFNAGGLGGGTGGSSGPSGGAPKPF
jgi:outer membrane protein assembly factor BamE (lipoprotein component of BamABCDE complex)